MMKFCAICRVLPAFLFCVFSLPQIVRAKLCSDVLSKGIIKEIVYKEPCVQKYTARCGWLSLNYCTFYHQTYCDKKKNDTVVTYYVVTHCCQGFYKAPNGTCISLGSGTDHRKITTKAPDYVFISNGGNRTYKGSISEIKHISEEAKITISGGGYAGIICGFVFLCTVVFFIIRAVRKRHTRKPRKSSPTKVEYTATPSSPPSPQIIIQPEAVPLSAAAASDNNDDDAEIEEIPESVV